MPEFFFVQRLEAVEDGHGINPFGSHPLVSKLLLEAGAGIELDYMGSSEFEGRRTIDSANRIANAAERLKVVTQQVLIPEATTWASFICTDEQVESTLPRFHEWVKNSRRTKERTGFFGEEVGDAVVAWWAIEEDLIWSKEPEVAERIKGAFVKIATQPAKN